jgi:nicotinate-nucleotide adenylyltransferase
MIKKRSATAIYGGAFDPIHNGHLATVAFLLNSEFVSRVIVVPSGDRPDKRSHASGADRLEMVRLGVADAFAGDSRVLVSDLHVSAAVGFGTIDLVDYYKQDPEIDLVVVIGHELVADLSDWKESERLKAEVKFLTIQRPGHAASVVPDGWRVQSISSSYDDCVLVSSTSLRRLICEGRSCAGLMPACVLEYCRSRGLYR